SLVCLRIVPVNLTEIRKQKNFNYYLWPFDRFCTIKTYKFMPATTPGIHPSFIFSHFDGEERAIINTLSKDWFVTNSGEPLVFNQAVTYKFILIKPTDNLQHAFNLERELVCVFSPFDDIHPRTLDAVSKAQDLFPLLRVDRICSLIVS